MSPNPACLRQILKTLVVALLVVTLASGSTMARAFDGNVEAGTVISNRAEATYLDAEGNGFGTVSPTIQITVRAVSGLTVTPDETDPSATVAPNQLVERLFRVCNTGNTPDLYTITAASVSAPATLIALHYDLDGSGTLTSGDRQIELSQTMSPRITRGGCIGVVSEVNVGPTPQNERLTIQITARSNVLGEQSVASQDIGTIINAVGSGARLTSPDDPRLPPVKLVEGRDRTTTTHGQTLNYSIRFRNSGDITARNVLVRDDLPEGLEYIPGTLKLEGRSLTDAEDADEGFARSRRVEIRLAEVDPDELVQITFQTRVTARVPPGTGLVNMAVVTAENAPSTSSTNAVAVVNPFGLVFQGRSSGTPIPNANVSILTEAANGQLLVIEPDRGSTPNERNTNPFRTDGQGRWSFQLAPAQLGTPANPARYFLNVTAPGYRSRMIEVSLRPASATTEGTNLFALTVRALDGQPIARNGSFDLTEEAVEVPSLAAFALNVPMFEHSLLEITKIADRPSVEIGDVVSYRVEVHNATAAALEDLTVSDRLPASFHYAAGSARVEVPPDAPRSVEPEQGANGELLFHLGRVPAGGRASIIYRVRVGANAREGEQFNTAVAVGTFPTGERTSTAQARAAVRVRRGVFSSQQIILGRVFDDANGNGLFDKGERPVAGVRLYLNNGQSVITDSAGLYTFPTVNEGAQVISLDPVTLPTGFTLTDTERRDGQSWARLLRTPLGGGALLRQNFALRAPASNGQETASTSTSPAPTSGARNNLAPSAAAVEATGQSKMKGTLFGASAQGPQTVQPKRTNETGDAPLASGTYEVASTVTLEPVAPGAVRIVSPKPEEVVGGAALEIEVHVAESWATIVEVEGERIPDSKIGERRVDRKNSLSTFTYVGINVQPGPNRIRVTPVSQSGVAGQPVELTAYGRGPAKRIEITPDKSELSAGGRDSTRLHVRAFDQWGHPAADTAVTLEASAGRLVSLSEQNGQGNNLVGAGATETNGLSAEQVNETTNQQLVTLTGGEAVVQLVADNAPGAAEIHASTGVIEARTTLRITPEVRPTILVGLAELSVGRAAPELSLHESDASVHSRVAFFFRSQLFGKNLLTLAYDSNRPLNRTAGRDRLFQTDPLDRAYPVFGDSSTRYEDAQSNSKVYARFDRGRSYAMFGDFDTENRQAGLASYTRKLTGVKLHLENSKGDFISVAGARPDTAFARDVFPGGGLSFARLTNMEVLPGSETVVLEVRDRRNPEIILSRETLVRSVDYNLDPASGELFFLRHISTFDFALNLVQIVVTYEHMAGGMSSAVYTGRAVKNFDRLGLRLGLSMVDQQQGEFGSFVVGGLDAEKKMPRNGTLRMEWATSRGRVAVGGNLFNTGLDERHDGNAYRAELEQPLPFKESVLRAGFARADEGFLNPFGATVTPGSQRSELALDMKVRPSSLLSLGVMDERNKTAHVSNNRLTGSMRWTESFGERLRATFGYDFRRLRDDVSGNETRSNLVTVGAEWQATDKLQLSAKREQNLGDADPTYPDQTTLAATYQWNQHTRLFFTQRLGSAPIVPIADASATGFFASASQRETAIGVETRLGRYASLATRYQLENGINGTDSYAVIGLSNRLPINKELSLDLGYERGFHLAGTSESFNSGHVGFAWQPTDNFRSSARYELRDRGGLGSVLTVGAAGRLFDNVTTLGRMQWSHISFGGRDNSSLFATAALAWRPLESDRAGLLFSYTRRDLTQSGGTGAGSGVMRDRADIISSDGYYQPTRDLELYGRFALKFGDTQTPELARVSALTYMMQGRASYRLGRYFDLASEMRWLAQPSSFTRRTSFGAELGYWVLSDLRVGGGYNWTGVSEPFGGNAFLNNRRGFYFTISSKLSNLFDLFGTSRDSLQAGDGGSGAASPDAGAPAGEKKREDDDEDDEEGGR